MCSNDHPVPIPFGNPDVLVNESLAMPAAYAEFRKDYLPPESQPQKGELDGEGT